MEEIANELSEVGDQNRTQSADLGPTYFCHTNLGPKGRRKGGTSNSFNTLRGQAVSSQGASKIGSPGIPASDGTTTASPERCLPELLNYTGAGVNTCYHLVMTNIAMENPPEMEVCSWEKHLFLWAILYGYVSHNQRVNQMQVSAPSGEPSRGRNLRHQTYGRFTSPDHPIFGSRGCDAPASNLHVVVHLVRCVFLPEDAANGCAYDACRDHYAANGHANRQYRYIDIEISDM